MGLYKRGKVWWVAFTYQGRQYRRSTETTNRKLAQEILDKMKYEIICGKWFESALEGERTFKEMADRYLEEHVSRKRAQRSYRTYAKNLMAFFDGYTLSQVTPEAVERYKRMRLEAGVKPATVNRDLAILKNMFNRAIYKWNPPWFKGENPVKRVEFEKENNKRTRWLSYEEEARLKSVSPKWLWEICLFAMETGLKQNELLSLTWPMVDLRLRAIVILETKNGEPRVVPLSKAALEVLTGRPRSLKTELVFYTSTHTKHSGRNVDRALAIALAKAGIRDFRFHDFRHTCATRLVQAGEDIYKVQRFLGHLSGETTKRYAHHSLESLRKAAESLDKAREKVYHNFITFPDATDFSGSEPIEIKEKAHVAQR